MFPGPNAEIYYNEAGEPIGWDNVSYEQDNNSYYCDICGVSHTGKCSWYEDEED